jgi:broad specificity phosphatase PhoE
MPWQVQREHPDSDVRTEAKVQIIDDVREWDYGNYEGLTSKTIAEQRARDGQEPWDIWRDGCPGGEYVRLSNYFEDFVNS